ncbi:MAG: GDSL-type esterase/lipase family protein [Victivallaceae bacterium]|nr:GDSL-type esterase/lipase family protein [Victivallaceae bacterium]
MIMKHVWHKIICAAAVVGATCSLGALEQPLIQLGADSSSGNTGSLPVKAVAAPNATLVTQTNGMTLTPLAEKDDSAIITFGHHPALNTNKFTLTAWVRLRSCGFEGNGVCLYDQLDDNNKDGFQLNLSFGQPGEIRLFPSFDGVGAFGGYFQQRVHIGDWGKWFFIALTCNGDAFHTALISDGVFEMKGPYKLKPAKKIHVNTLDPQLGLRRGSHNRAFRGNIADFRIYNRALSALELKEVAAEKKFAAENSREYPRVLLIGDSIRMGYGPLVRTALTGKIEIVWPDENCEDSRHIVQSLARYDSAFHPDMVYCNAGLHDIKTDRSSQTAQVTLEEYRRNLETIAKFFHDKKIPMIYALTTPVIDARHNSIQAFDRTNAKVMEYNKVAREVMKEYGVPVVDHYAIIAPERETLMRHDGVHMLDAGYSRLAKLVQAEIEKAAPAKK